MKQSHSQSGQTLIETLVAAFVLVMGIVAALGLAVYSLNASSNIGKQIIALGLAREGVEAMKNMRDTNWLKDTLSNNCYNYSDGSPSAPCYRNWRNPAGGFNIGVPLGSPPDPVTGYPFTFWSVDINPASSQYWVMSNFDPTGCSIKYGVNFDPNASGGRFYYPSPCNVAGNSEFKRQISTQEAFTPPFDKDVGPMIMVWARVWWTGKNCPASETFSAARPGCKVALGTRLTNWKNY